MKKHFVESLREGSRVEDVFLVSSKSVSSTRGGSPFLKLKLCDRTGIVDAVKWDVNESDIARVGEGDYVLVRGMVKIYNESPQIALDSCQRWGEEVNPSDFLRSTSHDVDKMMTELTGLLRTVTDPHLRQLLDSFFADETTAATFRQAPAAQKIHHAYIGGLLEHTLNVTRACASFADLYKEVDRDLLLTAAALHDIGKIREFTWNGAISYSEVGHLVGHVVDGAMMIRDIAAKIEGFDPLLSLTLQHMILAHHGTKEWGSPKQPKSIEAMMLHFADNLDANVAIFSQAIEDSNNNDNSASLFTKRHFLLERPIFKGLPRKNGNGEKEEAGEENDLNLFAADLVFDPFAD